MTRYGSAKLWPRVPASAPERPAKATRGKSIPMEVTAALRLALEPIDEGKLRRHLENGGTVYISLILT